MTAGEESTSKVKIRPLADRVVVRPFEESEQMRAGLHIPNTVVDKPQRGEVIAAGPGRIEKGAGVPMELKAGQQILCERYSGVEVTFDDDHYLIIRESDVLAVIEYQE